MATPPKQVKSCPTCRTLKDRSEFPTGRGACGECRVSRVCVTCDERKPVEQFPLAGGSKHRGTDRRIRRCHPCHTASRRKNYDSGPGRAQSFLWRYGITLEQRDEMLASQGGACAICLRTEHNGRDWCTDHDHACCPEKSRSCGKCVRGVLCFPCNIMLGVANDNTESLARAIQYLQSNVSRMTPI